MKYAIFDHMDGAGTPLHQQYEDRLNFISLCDRLGFYCYHLAEHHGTPLGFAPSPGIFLASAAQRSKRMRLGPLLFVLPIYHPVRAYEEICMLDQLSGGRLELGLGRGSMPYEIAMYGEDPATTQARYLENFEIIRQAFTQDEVSFTGKHITIKRFPVRIHPLQRPHPPLWYATTKPDSADWAAETGANIMMLGLIDNARNVAQRYRAAWTRLGRDPGALPNIGITRHVVVADTDAEAVAIGRRAYRPWRDAMEMLWKEAGTPFPIGHVYPDTFDELLKLGNGAAGSPQTVREILDAQAKHAGLNYFACQIYFGDMTRDEASHSASLFAEHVIGAHKTEQPEKLRGDLEATSSR
ncbi:LLM class flavin-dependent oxidoreductase [Pseudorhodoplanes sp.]|uniref:LLM class flavin-dependent oxidoreductase n=1 Tax=Pseudorhodoplanes sp. TaxID=1934341 RepID=UPI002C5A2368|nr:LLM class flavin-dependent oxidoreductase [Pseudorhodoplanes sp.]HWV53392.1 LLM class flavin-dependent oxidoreductase [Pseudorhodoplanes sp.]